MLQVVLARAFAGRASLVVACLALSACERVWYLTIVSLTDNRPEFCITRSKGCVGEGIQLRTIIVSQVDEDGKRLGDVWTIEERSASDQNDRIRSLVYGVAPKGWVEDAPAAPLRVNTYYSVNEQFYFILLGNGRSRVESLAEFSSRPRKP